MSKDNKDMINQMSGLSYEDIERLDYISNVFLGKGINDNKTMNDLWNEFTHYSKRGAKQKEWEMVGSDVIMEQWASELSSSFYETFGFISKEKTYRVEGEKQWKNFTDEELEMYRDLINEADEIFNKILE